MSKKITPSFVMNQIRNSVRSQKRSIEEIKLEQEPPLLNLVCDDSELSNIFSSLQIDLKRLAYRITPNMPVAFLEPHLVSKYKLLGKIIVPLRKLGARLFTKWYADTFSNQQKQLNNDIWFGLNSTINIVNEQNKLIIHLINKNTELTNKISQLKSRLDETEIYHSTTKEEFEAAIASVIEMYKQSNYLDFDYSKFAERFSASGTVVKEIYEQYIPYLQECEYVLDIGCGKGFFLELLREHDIMGVGVDSDSELINICIGKGFNAYTDDAINYLEGLEDQSVGGIFTGHVIEHLPAPLKIKFLKLCYRKLASNGKLIIETPNTTSSFVMHNLYYLDPTHEKPMFHETYKYIAEDVGFNVINSYLSSPIDETSPQEYYNFSLILSK